MHQLIAARLNLMQGKSQVVIKTICTDSLVLYLKTKTAAGAEVGIALPTQPEQKLGSYYSVTNDNGIQIKGPVIIGYIPLPREDAKNIFPKK